MISDMYYLADKINKGDDDIYIQTFSEAGTEHIGNGENNEDAIETAVFKNYIYIAISDGAGSSAFAKETSNCCVRAAVDFCKINGIGLFNGDMCDTAKQMLCFVRQSLNRLSARLSADPQEFMCTLMLLAVDTDSKRYTAVHIGDGLFAKTENDNTQIISYPENGVTKQYTYMINSLHFKEHLRIKTGKYVSYNTEFFVATDGAFENCNSTKQYIDRICNITDCKGFTDDATYCIVRPFMI